METDTGLTAKWPEIGSCGPRRGETVVIETRCADCKWVLVGDGLSCGHPSLRVEPEWVSDEDRAEPWLPVEPDGFCSKGERDED